MKQKPKTPDVLAIEAPVSIVAGQANGDTKSPPKFTAEFYTGGAMNIAGWDAPVVIDLAGLAESKVLVANLDHDKTKRVGNFAVANDGKSLVANGTATARTSAKDEVVGSAEDGYQWQASLEVNPSGAVEFVKSGKTAEANGQSFTGPLYVVRKGTLKGFAFVSHGADDNTTVSIAAGAASQKEQKTMKAEVKAWVEQMLPSLDVENLSADEIANLEADYAGRDGKRTLKAESGDSTFAKRKAEAKRRAEIRDVADRFIEMRNADETEIEAIEQMHDEAIEAGMSSQEFRLKMYETAIPVARGVFSSSDRGPKIQQKVVEAAVCMEGGMKAEALDDHFTDQELQTARDRYPTGIGLKQLWAEAAKANGYTRGGYDVTPEMQEYAFRRNYDRAMVRASAVPSTLDLASVLANTANKFLLAGWGAGEMTWQAITDVVNVRDFKTATFFKLSNSLKYKKIPPGGQIEHGNMSTDSYTVQADTYGIMLGVDRTSMINDDLGVITRFPQEMGYAANDAFNEVFWTEFLDNSSFFASGNNNVSTGAISATNALTALAAAEAVFFAQTRPNGTPLGILPNVWLLPPGTWRIGYNAIYSPNVTGGSSTVPEVNSLAGLYKPVMSAYIANASYSGYSTVKNYLLANRPGFSTMLTAFLNGRQSPVVETSSMEFNTLGVAMRAYHDFGCNKAEYRAGVQGSGA